MKCAIKFTLLLFYKFIYIYIIRTSFITETNMNVGKGVKRKKTYTFRKFDLNSKIKKKENNFIEDLMKTNVK